MHMHCILPESPYPQQHHKVTAAMQRRGSRTWLGSFTVKPRPCVKPARAPCKGPEGFGNQLIQPCPTIEWIQSCGASATQEANVLLFFLAYQQVCVVEFIPPPELFLWEGTIHFTPPIGHLRGGHVTRDAGEA